MEPITESRKVTLDLRSAYTKLLSLSYGDRPDPVSWYLSQSKAIESPKTSTNDDKHFQLLNFFIQGFFRELNEDSKF